VGPPTRISARHLEVLTALSYSSLPAPNSILTAVLTAVCFVNRAYYPHLYRLLISIQLLTSIREIRGLILDRCTDYYEDFFMVFLSSCRQISEQYLILGEDRVLASRFHVMSNHSTLYSLRCLQYRKIHKKKY
jgi:hypothetical protein